MSIPCSLPKPLTFQTQANFVAVCTPNIYLLNICDRISCSWDQTTKHQSCFAQLKNWGKSWLVWWFDFTNKMVSINVHKDSRILNLRICKSMKSFNEFCYDFFLFKGMQILFIFVKIHSFIAPFFVYFDFNFYKKK